MLNSKSKNLKSIYNCFLISNAVLGSTLILLAISYFYRPGFSAWTNIDNSLSCTTEECDSTYNVGCTNITKGTNTRDLTGKTVFASNCQQPENKCLISICNSTKSCVTSLIEGAECATTQNCEGGDYCAPGCVCMSLNSTMPNECFSSSDCPIIKNNPCAEFSCINNTCTQQTKSGMNCSSTEECGMGEFCSNCQCTSIASVQCFDNEDCGTLENNICAELVCLSNNTCNQQTKVGMNCSDTNECGPGEFCANGCQCTSIASVQCVNNEDCGTIENNNCAELVCLSNNTCNQQTKAGMNCSDTKECGSGEFCSNCQCTSIASVQCVNNEDCGVIETNICAEIVCLSNNTCNQQTKAGMNCSDTQECSTGQLCGPGCQCVSESSVQCVNNEDCGTLENNNCAEIVCLSNNTCNQQTKAGMNCSSFQECGSGEFCGPGCQCTSIASVQCVNNEDCGTIETNICAEIVCLNNNTCNQQTKAGMNCSDTNECEAGEFCGPGCQCTSISSVQCVTDADCLSLSNNQCAEVICNSSNVCVEQTISGNDCSTSRECNVDEICGPNCNCTGPYIIENTTISATSINFGQTSLNYYEEADFAIGTNGAITDPTVMGKFTRIGNLVIFFFPELTRSSCGSGTINSDSSTFIPTRFRPMSVVDYVIRALDGGTSIVGFIEIQTDGAFRIFASIGGSGFTAGSNCGNIHDIYITYMV